MKKKKELEEWIYPIKKKRNQFHVIGITEMNSQKLASLGESHSIVALLQFRILSKNLTHCCYLGIDIQEEAVLHILKEEPHRSEKMGLKSNTGVFSEVNLLRLVSSPKPLKS